MKSIISIVVILVVFSCNHSNKIPLEDKDNFRNQNNNFSFLQEKYCFSDGYNELSVVFKLQENTVYLYYYNIVENGNYLNGYDDSTDYAGKFLINDLSDLKTILKIKNYRFPDTYYMLHLKIAKDKESIIWEISKKEQPTYLPSSATLINCKKFLPDSI